MDGFRYWLLFLATASTTFIYGNRCVFSFTVICQQPPNATEKLDYYLSDSVNKAWMFTATALGMCVGPAPLYIAYKFDTRILLLVYGGLSTLTTLLYPLADSTGFNAAFISRFFAGFGQASQLHFANDFIQTWTPKGEQTLFFSILLTASQIGPLITMVLGGEMCSTLGWEYTYYVLALLTGLSTLAYVFFYTSNVEENRFCSLEEKTYILSGKTLHVHKPPVPYKKVLSNWTIWASFLLFSGYYIGMIVYQQYSPTFIRQVLNYSIRETGYFSAIPMIFAIVLKISVGKLIDHGMGFGSKWRLAGPLLFLEIISAICIFLTGYLDNRLLALLFDLIFASLHFFVPVICSRTIQVVAGVHAHFSLNLNMLIAGLIQIFLPGVVQLITYNNTREQWSIVFYIVAFLTIFTTTVYCIVTRIHQAGWAKPQKKGELYFERNFESFPRITLKQVQ